MDPIGIDSTVVPANVVITHPRLVVHIGNDASNRERVIEVTAQTTETGESPAKAYVRIQLDSKFPFTVEDVALSDVSQFLHFLNLQLEVPGFYLDLFTNTIIYRYVLLADSGHIPEKMILSMVGIVLFLQDVFGGPFERLATNKVTLPELLREIQSGHND